MIKDTYTYSTARTCHIDLKNKQDKLHDEIGDRDVGCPPVVVEIKLMSVLASFHWKISYFVIRGVQLDVNF